MKHYMPSFKRLRKSFKLRSKEYFRENTLHGFRYFVDFTRPMWERVTWCLCTLTSFIAAVSIIIIIWQKFQTKPTTTGLDTLTEDITVVMPSIKLCFTSKHLNTANIDSLQMSFYQEFYDWDWKKLNETANNQIEKQKNFGQLFLKLTPSCSDILSDCEKGGQKVICDKEFKKQLTPAGVCCISKSRGLKIFEINKSKINFVLKKSSEIKMYLMESENDMILRDGPINYHLNNNYTFAITLEVTEFDDNLHFLQRFQRACIFDDEDLNYYNCIYECQRKMSLDICHCLPWFLRPDKINQHCEYNGYTCLSEHFNEIRLSKCQSNCYLSCQHTYYSFAKISLHKYQTTIDLTSWPSVRYIQKVQFGWLDLLVSFGGIMGVFLGYSILTSVELAYYFSLRSYCGAIVDDDEDDYQGNFSKIQVKPKIKEKKKILNVQYFDYVN